MKRKGFTLAEVLITLGIIGIVAAMTIPTLINNVGDTQYKTAYKKAFSVANQAWAQAVNDNNIVSRTSWTDAAAKITNFNAYKSYFKVATDCNNSNTTQCWASGEMYYGGYPNNDALSFVDASGMSWSICTNTSVTGSEILVDTNGLKEPNKYGYDRFILYPLTSDGLDTGFPARIFSRADSTSKDTNYCLSGNTHPCLYQSWLLN